MENVTGPFIHTKNTKEKIKKSILISLLPLILFAFYKNGIVLFFSGKVGFIDSIYPLLLIFICMISMFIFDILYTMILRKDNVNIKKYIKTSYSFIPGIILGLIIPIKTPIIIIILSCFISVTIDKVLNKITNKNILNTVALSFLVIAIFSILNGGYSYLNSYEATKYNSAPIENTTITDFSYEQNIKQYGSLKQFFVGNVPGGIGEVSILFTIIGFLYLIMKKSIKNIIPVTIFITLFLGLSLTAFINNLDIYFVIFNLFTGSIIFSSIYICSEMTTTPVTKFGQILYGIIVAILTIIFRFMIPFGDIFLATIIADLLVPVINNLCI